MAELTVKDLESAFGDLSRCCLHSPAWTPVDVDRVLCSVARSYPEWRAAETYDIGGSDSESETVVRLKDGRYGLLSESSDYTGHGCGCGASAAAYATVNELLKLGVVDEAAREAIRAALAVPGAVVADSGELEAKGTA